MRSLLVLFIVMIFHAPLKDRIQRLSIMAPRSVHLFRKNRNRKNAFGPGMLQNPPTLTMLITSTSNLLCLGPESFGGLPPKTFGPTFGPFRTHFRTHLQTPSAASPYEGCKILDFFRRPSDPPSDPSDPPSDTFGPTFGPTFRPPPQRIPMRGARF